MELTGQLKNAPKSSLILTPLTMKEINSKTIPEDLKKKKNDFLLRTMKTYIILKKLHLELKIIDMG